MKDFLYGVAYYYEYLPYDRLDEDLKMMKAANINTIRIGESTWSTYETQEGKFDFSKLIKVLEKAEEYSINVIVGTPTYAVPTWMAKTYPEVLLTNKKGKNEYGPRQIIDITHPTFRFLGERIIRKMLEISSNYNCVIGYQVDNETKHFNTSSNNVYIGFQKWLYSKFEGDLENLNKQYGLDYWSNRINAWEDFPSINNTINGSLGSAFEEYKRTLVTAFLHWQVDIVNEYKKEEQFVTNNYDMEWRTLSYGLNPDSNHFEIATKMDVTSVDIYHPSQDNLTGIEIALCGDVARSTKQQNYYVMETEAQAFRHWLPYPGQLKLQAYSHIASGANMIGYWHWSSIHNSYETYWKGLLSHDFKPNPVYNEAMVIGSELNRFGNQFINTRKENKVGFLVSNIALSATDQFPYKDTIFDRTKNHQYNDVMREYYDALYKLNVESDFVDIETQIDDIDKYDLLIVPTLYSVSDIVIKKLNSFVETGGNILYTFRSCFTDENVKVRTSVQPGNISKVIGAEYQLFVEPDRNYSVGVPQNMTISGLGELEQIDKEEVFYWAELLTVTTGKSLAKYNHEHWGEYSAIVENNYGKGKAIYVGSYIKEQTIRKLYEYIFQNIDSVSIEDECKFPLVKKELITSEEEKIVFYLNYSNTKQTITINEDGLDLCKDMVITSGDTIEIKGWSAEIIKHK